MVKEGPFIEILMKYETDPNGKGFKKIEKRFSGAKKARITYPEDEILTGIYYTESIYSPLYGDDGKTIIEVAPTFLPSEDKKKLFDYMNEPYPYTRFTKMNIFSTITHMYTGENPEKPTHVLVQRRSKNVLDGHHKIQPASAGFIKYGQKPIDNVISEFQEEVSGSALGKKCNLSLKDIKITQIRKGNLELLDADNFDSERALYLSFYRHFMKGELENLGVSAILYIPRNSLKNFPEVRAIGHIEEVAKKQEGSFEVSALALVPVEYFNSFWHTVLEADKVFGPSLESSLSFERFFLKKFK